jgi:NADH-quinone oxidoreductase subunit M
LPEVHAEASTSGSVMLAGILLKLGMYGFIRFGNTVFPYGILYLGPVIFLTLIVGILLCSLNCLKNYDVKKIIAYSSVTHVNFAVASLYTLHVQGLMGCIVTSVSHGLSSSALFMALGILYDTTHSRNLFTLQALFHHYPVFSTFFFLFLLGNLSLPGLIGFYGELFSI